MIIFLADLVLVDPTADQWVDGCIQIMQNSEYLGAKIYPLLSAFGLIRALIKYV